METQATNEVSSEPIIETETPSVDSTDSPPQASGGELTDVRSEPVIETETAAVDSTDSPPQASGGESTQVCSEPVIETETVAVESMSYRPPQTADVELQNVCSEPVNETESLSATQESGHGRRNRSIILNTVLVFAALIIAIGIGLAIAYVVVGEDLFSPIITLKKFIDAGNSILFLLLRK